MTKTCNCPRCNPERQMLRDDNMNAESPGAQPIDYREHLGIPRPPGGAVADRGQEACSIDVAPSVDGRTVDQRAHAIVNEHGPGWVNDYFRRFPNSTQTEHEKRRAMAHYCVVRALSQISPSTVDAESPKHADWGQNAHTLTLDLDALSAAYRRSGPDHSGNRMIDELQEARDALEETRGELYAVNVDLREARAKVSELAIKLGEARAEIARKEGGMMMELRSEMTRLLRQGDRDRAEIARLQRLNPNYDMLLETVDVLTGTVKARDAEIARLTELVASVTTRANIEMARLRAPESMPIMAPELR